MERDRKAPLEDTWFRLWRKDRAIFEWICPHGVGHPDPLDIRVMAGLDDGVHGCDGCCVNRDGDNERTD